VVVPEDESAATFDQHEERYKFSVTPEERYVRVIHEELEHTKTGFGRSGCGFDRGQWRPAAEFRNEGDVIYSLAIAFYEGG